MKSEILASREFIRGAARFRDLVYVISKSKKLIADDVAHSSLIAVDGDSWGDGVDTTWNSSAIAVARKPAEKVVMIGEDGDVATYVGGESTEEKLEPAPAMIRNAREIGGFVYACGMKRQVYKRAGEGRWVAMNAPAAKPKEKFGFETIDGVSDKEIYAAGWGGEIWRYDGKTWTECESPTKVILSALCCAPKGIVYVAGQQGTLLEGKKGVFGAVQWKEDVTADFTDLCWFEDKLYVATATALYTLGDGRLTEVDFGQIGPEAATASRRQRASSGRSATRTPCPSTARRGRSTRADRIVESSGDEEDGVECSDIDRGGSHRPRQERDRAAGYRRQPLRGDRRDPRMRIGGA